MFYLVCEDTGVVPTGVESIVDLLQEYECVCFLSINISICLLYMVDRGGLSFAAESACFHEAQTYDLFILSIMGPRFPVLALSLWSLF